MERFNEKFVFNVENGDIGVLANKNSIVNQINNAFDINTDWDTIANVNFIDINISLKNLTKLPKISTSITVDITGILNQLNEDRVKEALKYKLPIVGAAFNFFPHSVWDIKNSDNKILGGGAINRSYLSYIYDGQLIRYDAPGNINFGYVMHALGVSLDDVKTGAVWAQIGADLLKGEVKLGDNPGDWEYIEMGYNLYK